MRSVPACYPNVDLNTTERWFENFHFCNLLSFVKPRLERNLAVVSKSGTISLPTHSVGGDVEGTAQERREREGGGLKLARPPTGACGGSKPSVSARGFGSTYRNLRALEADPSAATETKGGDSDNCWRISQPIGMGSKELTVRSLEVGIVITRSTAACHYQIHSGVSDPAQGFVLREEKRLHASPITYD